MKGRLLQLRRRPRHASDTAEPQRAIVCDNCSQETVPVTVKACQHCEAIIKPPEPPRVDLDGPPAFLVTRSRVTYTLSNKPRGKHIPLRDNQGREWCWDTGLGYCRHDSGGKVVETVLNQTILLATYGPCTDA